MLRIAIAAILCVLSSVASSQTSPGFSYGQVPTVAAWNQLFAAKQDYLGALPILPTGGTMTGKLATAASNTTRAGFNIPAGVAPSAPVNGDMWTTASGVYIQIAGVTVGPLSGPSSGSFAATAPLSVTFPSSVVTYACATCGVTTSPLSQFASTTSAQLAGVLSDETGTGVAVFGTGPTLTGVTITTSFTATGLVGLPSLASQAANTVVMNGTGSAASPVAYAMPSCVGSANALQWTSGTGFTCSAIVAAAGSVAVGTTTITSGTSGRVLYDNAGVLGELTVTGTAGNVVLSSSPTIASPTFSGTVAGAGTIPNSVLVNSSTTVNGQTCTLGSTCTITAVAATITIGTTAVASGTDQFILYNNAGTLGNVGTSGTGLVARVTSPTFTTPSLGAAAAASIAINSCTIGSAALCTTGNILAAGVFQLTVANTLALVAGPNGTTNPTFVVDTSTASAATGVKITGAAAGSRAFLAAISSATDEGLSIDAKGSGTIRLGDTSTGSVILSRALTYGGVTLSNAVTGTGNMVLSASPTITGTLSTANQTITSSSANAFAVGPNGTTNPTVNVITNVASAATGLQIASQAAGGGIALLALSSGTDESIAINAKGAGSVKLQTVGTGAVTIGSAGSVVGKVAFNNATSGTITIQPTTGALGSAVLTLPAVTDTLAGVSIANAGTGGSLTASDGGIVYSDSTRLQILAGTATAGQCLLSNSNSAPAWGSCAGGAAVSSVSNSDGTLTISPTTGAVVASIDLTHANVWTGVQSFTASGIKLKGSSTGYTTFASANASATNYTITFPALTATATVTVASGAKALATSAISSGACSSAQTDTATGTLTTDVIDATFAADPTSTTGYQASTSGMLTIISYPTADTVNFKVCNNTGASITPGAVTINWRVRR